MWRSLAKANKSILDLLCEVVALASSEEEDQDYEEVEDDDNEEVKDITESSNAN